MPIIREIEKMSGKAYDPDGETLSFKVMQTTYVHWLAIGDGALPGVKAGVMFFVVFSVVP
ncbi:MAG: hypothetical protein ACLTOX_01875 [Streptococcus thermophilus]